VSQFQSCLLILRAGALGFGLLGAAKPQSFARMIHSDEDTARAIGYRDLGNAALLLASENPRAAIVQRTLYDLSDAWVFGRRNVGAAVSALAFAAVGGLALRSNGATRRR
jgi:hypothetical protein